MPITSHAGGTMITGQGIPLYRLLTMKHGMLLEEKGLRLSRGMSATTIAMREFNIPGKATKKNRALALKAIEQKITEVGNKVEAENAKLPDSAG